MIHTSDVKLTILGKPMGKQRPKFSNIGRFVKAYTPKQTINYESQVVAEYKANYKEPMFKVNDEIRAIITAYFKIPKANYHFHKKTQTTDLDVEGELMLQGKLKPMKAPDVDNIAKICLDALNGIAYPDDCQITCLHVEKYYSEEPRVEISLQRVWKPIVRKGRKNGKRKETI